MAKIFNKRRELHPNGKVERNFKTGHHTTLVIRNELWALIKNSPYSASKLLDIALNAYFKDQFKIRLENSLHALYEDVLMLEKLKDVGKMGLTKFSDEHLMQIESYRDAIKILENSPLVTK